MKYSWKKHCVLVLAVSLVSACSNGGSGAGGVGDTQPPTDPSNLVATAASVNQIDLTWTAATDNVGVTGYQILRDGAVIATTVSTTYTDSGLAMSSLYTYTVKALDAAGNSSSASGAAEATTLSSAPTPTVYAISLPRTGQTTSYAPRDDGALQKGAVWSDWPNYRFTNANGTTPISGNVVIDQLTGLMWTKDGNAPGPAACDPGADKTWQAAVDYVACLNINNYLGYTDWRLPNINELESLVDLEYHGKLMNLWLNDQGFVNVRNFFYWSSTTNAGNAGQAWDVYMGAGTIGINNNKTSAYAVWPVRTGLTIAPASLPVTGQTTTYTDGDDGTLRYGIAWPELRFTNPDGTAPPSDSAVIDNLTGLMWTRDGNAPGPFSCGPATAKTWVGALEYISCLNTNNYLGHSDWRLPNAFEMRSLVNAGEANTAVWLNIQGFTHQQASYYWSSTTYPLDTTTAIVVHLQGGNVDRDSKTFDYGYIYVWPVRDAN